MSISIDETGATDTYKATTALLKHHQVYSQEYKDNVIADTKEFYTSVHTPPRISLEYLPQNLLYFIALESRLHSEIHYETFEQAQAVLLDIFLPSYEAMIASDFTLFTQEHFLSKLKEVFYVESARKPPLLKALRHWAANGHDQHKPFIEALLALREHMNMVEAKMNVREIGDAINEVSLMV